MKRLGIPEWRVEDATVPITNTLSILQSYGYYVAQDMTIDRASDWLWANRPVQVFSTYFRLRGRHQPPRRPLPRPALYKEAVVRERAGTFDAAQEARLDEGFARVLRRRVRADGPTIAKYARAHGPPHAARRLLGPRLPLLPGRATPTPTTRRSRRTASSSSTARASVAASASRGARLYDVAPTILYAMGQPAASRHGRHRSARRLFSRSSAPLPGAHDRELRGAAAGPGPGRDQPRNRPGRDPRPDDDRLYRRGGHADTFAPAVAVTGSKVDAALTARRWHSRPPTATPRPRARATIARDAP